VKATIASGLSDYLDMFSENKEFIFFSSQHKINRSRRRTKTKYTNTPEKLQLELCILFATLFPTIMSNPQHADTERQTGSQKQSSSEPASSRFPARLHRMLYDAEEHDFSDVVSWNSDGASFRVHSPQAFTDTIMPTYFNQTKYKSFQRQLNSYGFIRIQQGFNRASYANANFRRGDLSLSLLHPRSGTRSNSNNVPPNNRLHGNSDSVSNLDFEVEPISIANLDFEVEPISLLWEKADIIDDTILEPVCNDSSWLSEMDFNDLFEDDIDATVFDAGEVLAWLSEVRHFNDIFDTDAIGFDAPGDVNDVSNDPLFQSMMNDPILLSLERNKSVSDFLMIDDTEKEKQHQVIEVSSTRQTEHSFPWKLHDMLEAAESNNFSHIVSWEPDGVSFQVHKGDEFSTKILPLYFDHTKYNSFRRQLNKYGFSRVAQGRSSHGIYYHASLVKRDRSLCKEIKRELQHQDSISW
jgi:hypothetical protein